MHKRSGVVERMECMECGVYAIFVIRVWSCVCLYFCVRCIVVRCILGHTSEEHWGENGCECSCVMHVQRAAYCCCVETGHAAMSRLVMSDMRIGPICRR